MSITVSGMPAFLVRRMSEQMRDSPVPRAAKLFDFVLCVCATFKPADSEEEVVIVSRMVCDVFTMVSPLPSLTECDTPKFCSKTMVSLALFHDHMVRRTERYGAPKPAYYRAVAKNRLNLTGRAAVAEHHEQWESFLGENLL